MLCPIITKEEVTMKRSHWFWPAALLVAWTLTGCGKTDPEVKVQASFNQSAGFDGEIRAARAKLSTEDQELVAAQEYCAVRSKNRLGSMGVPFKVLVEGQPVFLCCDGCQEQALTNPEKTLARVNELKARSVGAGK
jgi:hypothetical protein